MAIWKHIKEWLGFFDELAQPIPPPKPAPEKPKSAPKPRAKKSKKTVEGDPKLLGDAIDK